MTPNEQILADIHTMKSELKISLADAEGGTVVDISKIPEKLSKLHTEVAAMDISERGILVAGFDELLTLLDDLSKVIQKSYKDISSHIKLLDGE